MAYVSVKDSFKSVMYFSNNLNCKMSWNIYLVVERNLNMKAKLVISRYGYVCDSLNDRNLQTFPILFLYKSNAFPFYRLTPVSKPVNKRLVKLFLLGP